MHYTARYWQFKQALTKADTQGRVHAVLASLNRERHMVAYERTQLEAYGRQRLKETCRDHHA